MLTITASETSFVTRYRVRMMLFLAVMWTAVTVLVFLNAIHADKDHRNLFFNNVRKEQYYLLHLVILTCMSFLVSFIFVWRIKSLGDDLPLWLAIILKSILLGIGVLLIYAVAVFAELLILHRFNFAEGRNIFSKQFLTTAWVIGELSEWMLIFLFTQILIEVNEKYSPGLFLDLLSGKYKKPRSEKRIVIFLDLKDSTPIAEKLGDQRYFEFIRDFINTVSEAFLDNGGNIYQYVGDEVVISWKLTEENKRRCLRAIIRARTLINKRSDRFRRRFNIVPEFRIGMHIGSVTIGEIGIVKKDLAMSGDTMNTTARIRSACSEMNEKILVSRAFIEAFDLDAHQYESKGSVSLKGKTDDIELFCINT